ncbi:MAG: hypothetical protein LC624_00165 [Halobacteriales archaeon]|nr:hypothetical protein [Halobacteriales archaeon]
MDLRALDYGTNPATAVEAGRGKPPGRVWLDAGGISDRDLGDLAVRLGLSRTALTTSLRASTGASSLAGAAYLGLRLPDDARLAVVLHGPFVLTVHGSDDLVPLAELRELLLDEARGQRVARHDGAFLVGLLLERITAQARRALEERSEDVERIEERAMSGPREDLARRALAVQRALLRVERSLFSVQRAAADLAGSEAEDIDTDAQAVLQRVTAQADELIDHAVQSRDLVQNALTVHLGVVSNQLNDTMRVLTVLTTAIFVPALIAGVYGMNFHDIPELSWPWGYPYALALMLASAVAVLWGFRRAGFWGPGSREPRA